MINLWSCLRFFAIVLLKNENISSIFGLSLLISGPCVSFVVVIQVLYFFCDFSHIASGLLFRPCKVVSSNRLLISIFAKFLLISSSSQLKNCLKRAIPFRDHKMKNYTFVFLGFRRSTRQAPEVLKSRDDRYMPPDFWYSDSYSKVLKRIFNET